MTAIPPEAANVLAMILHKAETGGTPGGAPTTDSTTAAPTSSIAASPTGTLPQGGNLDDTLARTNAEGQGIINRASQAGSQTADTSTVTDIPPPVNTTTATPGADAVGLVNPRVSQGYGGGTGHPGVDLGIPSGTPLVAAESGHVTAAGNTDPQGYGNEVEITADNGVVMRYGHLSSVGVKLGDTVSAGQPIGKSGGDPGDPNKGNARGAHLHFEVRVGGHTVDPLPYLAGGAGVVAGTSTGNPAAQMSTTVHTSPVVEPANVAQNILDVAAGKQPTNQTQTTTTTEPVPGQPQASGAKPSSQQGPIADLDGLINQAVQITGVPASWIPGIKQIMIRESGGQNIPQGIHDINTDKGTPAFGPMQIIQPTFNANALKGYEDWHNPLDSTIAAIRYIQSRYGSPYNGPTTSGY